MCDVFPASMAFAMQACTQYRTRVLDNGSARRLNELFEAHVRGREKRQIADTLFVAASLYGGYKIIGDLFRGSKDEMVHRLDENENFQKHQEKLDDVLVTSILSLEDNNLVMLKSFKSLFDSVNATRSLVHSLLKMSLREQRTFTGWARFSLKSEMRRHYEQMVSAFSRVANHDLNLEMFSPEQRTFVHDFLWNRIRYSLPLNFSASLAQFVPNLIVQQIIYFVQVNENEIVYDSKEDEFKSVVKTELYDAVARNETTDLDSILPKVVGHARIENFVDIPTTFLNKTMDLYKITRLPLFVDERKAVYAANRPVYLLFGHDGRSEEWFDHAERKCTMDEISRYMFCSAPVPIFSTVQHPCLKSIILNNSTKDCLKETVDLSSPYIVKFAANIHAISVRTLLQCFEKGDKGNSNIFSNITKVAILKTRCNSFVSCGTLDFSSVGGVCNTVERYIFTFNNTYENPFTLDKSVNPVDVDTDNLNKIMDISSLIESALSHEKYMEDAHIEFEYNIHRMIKKKAWSKIIIGFFILISNVTICTIVFASRTCLKIFICFINWQKKIACLFQLCSAKKKNQINDSPIDMYVPVSSPARKNSNYDNMYLNKKNTDTLQPRLKNFLFSDRMQHSMHLNHSLKEMLSCIPTSALNCIPATSRISSSVVSPNVFSSEIIRKKPNPLPRKLYDYVLESVDLSSRDSSITSGEFFEEDQQSE
ncbi:unnamed protein product [Rotaria magnacalcarata]|uniref:Uncharacterized protein n=1 Tax=Rotaria magnacalcarata TaxID=392030 RepID=A0A8S2ZG19_9BILA|nr:unnamed protein product [Rotaria magnacalcarata]